MMKVEATTLRLSTNFTLKLAFICIKPSPCFIFVFLTLTRIVSYILFIPSVLIRSFLFNVFVTNSTILSRIVVGHLTSSYPK